ncbi:MAG: orotate phosphoribosyltransferase [Myxococcales bacterium]|nr:orotate phosphoribosyltransferase [Myxococcales bacterium]
MSQAPSAEALLALLATLSWRRGPVVLASGATSDFYVDCKQTALHPAGAAALGALLLDAVEAIEAATGQRAEGVGGMTLGADPLATAVSLTAWQRGRHLPAFIVRKSPKSHGTEAYLEGRANLPDAAHVVLLEDVVTSGGSTLLAAQRVRGEGLRPFGVACIVDRQAGGLDRLAADGLTPRALFTRADFEALPEAT